MSRECDPTYLDELHFAQHWHLDPTCNWKEFTQNVYTTPTSELIQQRTIIARERNKDSRPL